MALSGFGAAVRLQQGIGAGRHLLVGGGRVPLGGLFQLADPLVQGGEPLGHDIGQVLLVEVVGRVDGLVVDPHHFGGHAHRGAVGGQVFQHHAARAHAGVVPDVDRAQHLGARADQDVVAQGGVALAGVLAGAAQGDAVVDGAVVADLGGLAKDDAHAVVDEQPAADGGAGVNLDAGLVAAPLADPPGQEKVAPLVQPVGDAVVHQDVKARVQQHDFQHGACGRVLALDVAGVVK